MTSAHTPDRRILLLLLAFVALGFVAILLPFYGTLLWGLIIALLFTPMFRWLCGRLHGRHTLAAALTLLFVFLIVLLPLSLLAMTLANQAAALYNELQSGQLDLTAYLRGLFDRMPAWLASPLGSLGLGDFDALQRRLAEALSDGTQLIATRALRWGQNTFGLLASLFVMLYLAFFLIRDGDSLMATLRRSVPLSKRYQDELLRRFTTAIGATVKGTLVVAVIQGALGGLAFWWLDLPGALLWAVVMGFLSLLPAVGAALVWFPVVLYYLSMGELPSAIGLAVWGVVVIGLVDNLLRPVLVGKETRLPDWVVLVTTLGGLAVFGINGFVLGPVIAAVFFAIWPLAMRQVAGPGRDALP